MPTPDSDHIVSKDKYDAVLFDLDGVITDTASVHSVAWKALFDEYLKYVAERDNVPFKPFEIEPDYRVYVDGKPRYDGVDSFLRSRGIELPWGDPSDGPDQETVCGLGNKKNALFNDTLKKQGADVFETSVQFVRDLKQAGIKVGIVSSSKNCTAVLESVGILDLFDVQVDGVVAAEENLPGKPDPDTYLAAARRVGASAERSVVVEDAISGVQAGRAGNFGLVIGVDRHDEAEALAENGADVVVKDIGEVSHDFE